MKFTPLKLLKVSRRRSVVFLSGAAILTSLAGCSGGNTEASTQTTAASTQTEDVTINVVFSFEPPPQAALDAFTKETGIKVNWTNVDWDALQTKISAAAQAGVYFADVSNVDWARVGQLGKLGWFLPMNDYLDTESMATDMPQLDEFTLDGQVIGIPFDSSFMVTTINKAMFDKAGITTMPTTIDEYTKDLQEIKAQGIVEYPLNIGFDASEETSTSWYQATAAFGGTILDADGKPQFTSPSSPGYKAAEWMVSSLKSGLIPPGNINVKNSVSQQTLMAKGLVASTFADYAGNVGALYDVPSESTVVNQIQYIRTPGVDGVGPNLGNPDGIGIPKQAKYPEAAAKFIEWVTSSTNQANFAGANAASDVLVGYEMPSRISAAEAMAANGELTGSEELLQMLENSKPVFPQGAPSWYPEFSGAVNVNLHAAAVGSMTVPEAIAAIAAVADRLSSSS